MPDFNPNDVDALFREGAERHEFEYNPDSWALMEQKLDKKKSNKRFFFYLLGLILLLSSVAVYSVTQWDSNNSQDEIIASEIIENVSSTDDVNNSLTHKEENTTTNTLLSDNSQEIKKEYISTDSKESSSNIGAQNSFQSEDTGNLIGNEIVSIDSQNSSFQDGQQIQENTEEHILDSTSATSNNTDTHNNIITHIDIEPTTESLILNKQISVASLVNIEFKLFDFDFRNLESAKLKPSQTAVKPILLASVNRYAFTVFANPEWSSVGLFQDSKAGWSIGTKFGYQFADKFEVSAGLAYSRKIYKGAGKEYQMQGGWIYDIEPMEMDAKCDVIEIPVALSYYMNGYRNSGFFADLGINSYMLHSEWYGFNFDDALVRPERYKEVIEEDANTHLVGVGRIAIGYQKVLSNHTSLQIAPYLQFPLTGIGAGKVNLYSSGVQIAVKFNTQ